MVDTNHKIAFCIDSDGCAMDTMTYKHQLFFGPIAADIFGISEQERTSFLKEWEEQGLLKYVDDIYCQDRGKKEDVIATLIANDYCRDTILMVGDSPGDLAAAEQNGIAFYPVLVGKEVKSWEILREDIGEAFAKGQFEQQRQKESINTFWANLDN
ncbi:TPA: HAD family hydrolase [Streptococcus agalactiae]